MTTKDKHTKHTPNAAATEDEPVADASSAAASAKAGSVSEQELEDLKAKAAKADENWDRFLRATAELENYRKRAAREKEELARFTSERVLSALLPVLDNLERAIDAAQQHGAEISPLLEGITQVHNQFRRALLEFGLREIAANVGHPFDPNLHEAVSHIESAEHPEGHVVEQLQRGYKLADRLLRPARVVVSKGVPTADKSQEDSDDAGVPASDSK
jgi:molecular chaperone GrpE